MTEDICGAETSNGEPCQNPKNSCPYHEIDEYSTALSKDLNQVEFVGSQEIQDIKKDFLDRLSSKVITIEKASKKAGRDPSQIWRWRQEDAEFDNLVQEAKRVQSEQRLNKVEDSLFKRIVKGDAAASETIFYLKNKDPAGWSDVQEHYHKGDTGPSTEEIVSSVQENLERAEEVREDA